MSPRGFPPGSSLPVIVNRRARIAAALGHQLEPRLRAAFAAHGLDARLEMVDGARVAEAIRAHAAAPLVVAGGGDGTLGTALAARRGAGALGLLPLGTRNHLARDLGLPADLAAAARVIAAGHVRAIDLATVNGHAFVNNASVGLYPLMVRRRDAHPRWPKWLATIPAAWGALARLPSHRMHLHAPEQAHHDFGTPLLFVGNNRYAIERGRLGQRAALDDGLLSVFAVASRGRGGLVWLAVRALVGRIDLARDFAAVGECATLVVRSRAGTIDVALDGEVHRLRPPLRFAVARRALRVCAPDSGGAP